ncbi:MAG: hypothetical protein IJ104_00740 [Methanobrevibacter sp.]|nr:hypothetical protein [Methanobrevibacter sp.]MBQ9024896.1 hypothetical protein [Methanobrevibacter sp.]
MIEPIMQGISFMLIFICGISLGFIISDKLNSKMIKSLLESNEITGKIIIKLAYYSHTLEKRNKSYEHELTSIDGLYVADNPEFKNSWRLDFKELLKKDSENDKND